MKLQMTIPKEFDEHFRFDRFKDSLGRIRYDLSEYIKLGRSNGNDICSLSGPYEQEIADALPQVFTDAKLLSNGEIQVDLTSVSVDDFDKFKESLGRIRFDLSEYIKLGSAEGSDVCTLSGLYEQELADVLPHMFECAKPLNDGEVRVYLTPVSIGFAGKKEE